MNPLARPVVLHHLGVAKFRSHQACSRFTRMSGTLITPRHVLAASHCFCRVGVGGRVNPANVSFSRGSANVAITSRPMAPRCCCSSPRGYDAAETSVDVGPELPGSPFYHQLRSWGDYAAIRIARAEE